jgi:ribosomal-protein-alanine N-acetyltransferase
VIKEFQRQGAGALLCEYLLQRAKAMGALRMFLEVRAGNIAGRALYRRLGFAQIGQRRGYYADADNRREDAIVMEKTLSG